MKTYCLAIIILCSNLLFSCKKENKIRHEISGTWKILKSERIYYVNGVEAQTEILEDPGEIIFDDDKGSPEYNTCYFNFTNGYWPLAFNELSHTARSNKYAHWITDPYSRERITIWESSGFAGVETYLVFFDRTKRAGSKEQWVYAISDGSNVAVKEILHVKITKRN